MQNFSLSTLLQNRKTVKIILIAGIGLILLLFLSTISFGGEAEAAAAEDYSAIERELEQRLCRLIFEIDGAGNPTVMVTLETTSEKVFAQQTKTGSSSSGGAENTSASANSETEIVLAGSSREALETSVILPKVRGVAIVCKGASSASVKEKVVNAVSGVLNISKSRIYVTN